MTIPRNARKLTIHSELWFWKTNGWDVNIWDSNGKKYDVRAESAFGQYNRGCDCCNNDPAISIEPGMVRQYIEENLMKEVPNFVPEEPEVGKLYVYRYANVEQGSSIKLISVKGGDYDATSRYNQFFALLSAKHPIFLVNFKTNLDEKVGYAKILVGDILADLEIKYPRTFRASFIRQEEWKKIEER